MTDQTYLSFLLSWKGPMTGEKNRKNHFQNSQIILQQCHFPCEVWQVWQKNGYRLIKAKGVTSKAVFEQNNTGKNS